MRIQWLFLFSLLLGLGCGKAPVSGSMPADLRTVSSDMLIFDDQVIFDVAALRAYAVGEDVPYTGYVEWRHSNGELQQQSEFNFGVEHGSTIWWHEDGTRAGQTTYNNGMLNGPMIQWHLGGEVKELQANYKDGKQEGREISWHSNGREESIVTYVSGLRQGLAKGWYDDGSEAWEAGWVDDEPHGMHVEWYSTGQTNIITHYNMGTKHGVETFLFEHGQKSTEVKWEKGVRQGMQTEWYEEGNKMKETTYANDLREGTSTGWYENGKKAFEIIYFKGHEVSFKEWKEDGSLLSAPPPVAMGRKLALSKEGIEQYFVGKARKVLYDYFGEPDKSGNNTWRYDGINIAGKADSMLITFTGDFVAGVKVGEDALGVKEESEGEEPEGEE